MIRPRSVLLSLYLAMFGTFVLNATVAQAEPGAQWLFAEKAGSNLVPFLSAFIGFRSDTPIILHTEILKIKVLFECKSIAAVNASLKANGSIGGGAKFKYSECITKLNGSTSAQCEPNAGGEKGVVNTNGLHALMVLHEGLDLILVLPDFGETVATIEMGAACPIGTKVPIVGTFTLKDCQGLILTHLVEHLLELGPLDGLWAISKTTEHTTAFLGSWWARLIFEHEGLKWSGDPA